MAKRATLKDRKVQSERGGSESGDGGARQVGDIQSGRGENTGGSEVCSSAEGRCGGGQYPHNPAAVRSERFGERIEEAGGKSEED